VGSPTEAAAAETPEAAAAKALAGMDLFLASYDSAVVKRFDARTGKFLDDFAVGNDIRHAVAVLFGPDGHLYVACDGSQAVKRFHGKTGAFINDFVPSGSGGLNNPNCMAFGPGGHLYVSSAGTNEIKCYNGRTGEFLGNSVPAGSGGL